LSWEERNIQDRINTWAREQRGKGLEVKVRLDRVRVKGFFGLESMDEYGKGRGKGRG